MGECAVSEVSGFQCDGGCGASLVIDRLDTPTAHGWAIVLTPRGEATQHACSPRCLIRAVSMRHPEVANVAVGDLPRARP